MCCGAGRDAPVHQTTLTIRGPLNQTIKMSRFSMTWSGQMWKYTAPLCHLGIWRSQKSPGFIFVFYKMLMPIGQSPLMFLKDFLEWSWSQKTMFYWKPPRKKLRFTLTDSQTWPEMALGTMTLFLGCFCSCDISACELFLPGWPPLLHSTGNCDVCISLRLLTRAFPLAIGFSLSSGWDRKQLSRSFSRRQQKNMK